MHELSGTKPINRSNYKIIFVINLSDKKTKHSSTRYTQKTKTRIPENKHLKDNRLMRPPYYYYQPLSL